MAVARGTTREKIAILGGGMGAIATAWALTQSGRDYEITIYQQGWRIGGKGASGRNLDPAYGYRIEEHGLHIWAGLYDNAFRAIRECYAALDRPPDAPLATWRQAFTPRSFLVLQELYRGERHDWTLTLPTNEHLPGDPDATLFLSRWDYVRQTLHLMRQLFAASPQGQRRQGGRPWGRLGGILRRAPGLLRFALRQAEQATPDDGRILAALDPFMAWLWGEVRERVDEPRTRRYWAALNFLYGNLRGVLRERLLERGFDVIDEQDYRAWLAQHIVDDARDGIPSPTLHSPLAWFVYDANFAFREGDPEQPAQSAAVVLKVLVRLAFSWKGALMWEMNGGMGDVVFAPFYEVLRRRGVRFKFFHQVRGLHLTPDRRAIGAITMARQATVKGGEYEPLVPIKGLPCWPSTPLYEQLVEGEALRGVNLEAPDSPAVETQRLEVGRDFDRVVLAISLAALPALCGELLAAAPRWQAMVERVGTVRTQAAQLWLKPTLTALGWRYGEPPLFNVHGLGPLTTWADMSFLLPREGWPARGEQHPLSLAYFCGPLRDDAPAEAVAEALHKRLPAQVAPLWPHAIAPDGTFRWSWLVDNRPDAPDGPARLHSQYLRANVAPSERYVLSLPGTARYRLEPGDSGFANLVLAGDWTQNGFNAGNVEATTISGLLASHAISGYPARAAIVGLDFGKGTG